MKTKFIISILLLVTFIYGCTKTEESQTEILKSETNPPETIYYEKTFENTDISIDEDLLEEYTDYEEVERMDENYDIHEVIGHNNDLFIPEHEKFWVRADYYNNQTREANKAYILTDAYLHIFKELSIDIGMETVISEDVLVIRDSENRDRYHIIDGNGNDISLKYIDEGEDIIRVFNSDNNLMIFTLSTEDTYSTQNVIFKVYDENKNCLFHFSKQEVNTKYGVDWICSTENIDISDLGSGIYCIIDSGYDYFYNLDNQRLYIDLIRKKVFIGEKNGIYSDGEYIWCTENVIDIDSETSTPSNIETLKYRDTYAHRVSNVWNGKFIASTYIGASRHLYSSEYAIYDCQGNLICDLESDTVNVTEYNGIYDGYSLIEITNEGGTEYVTVIDENGKWQFEPIQGKIVWNQYIKSTEQFVAVKNDYTGLILINQKGEQEELPIPVAENYVYNGVALTQTEEGMQYILYGERGHAIGQKETSKAKFEMNQEDFIIDWQDENLEDAMRQVTGITDRDIMLSDVIGIEELNLLFTEVENIDSLRYLTNLQELHLVSGKFMPNGTSFSSLKDDTPIDLSALSNLTKLKILQLEGKKIKDISPLANLQNLEVLSLCGGGGTSMFPTMVSDITPLSKLTNLKILNMPRTQVTNIEPIANLTNLEKLDLTWNHISDTTPLSNLEHLTRLNLFGTDVTDINSLSTLHQLESLDLGDTQITNLEPLKDIIQLKNLNLYNTNIVNLNVLSNLPQLTSLGLYNTTINDFDIFKDLTHLVWLDLRQTGLSDISFLQNLTNLEELYLPDNSITNIEPLSNLTNLKYLDLTGNPITDYSPVSFVETVLKD